MKQTMCDVRVCAYVNQNIMFVAEVTFECPHCVIWKVNNTIIGKCALTQKELDNFAIPSWCPLPDKESK